MALSLVLKTFTAAGLAGTYLPSSFCSQDAQIPPIALDSEPGRGIGVIATRLIPAGSIILKEEAILTVPDFPDKAITPDIITNLVEKYTNLPPAMRQQILGLYAHTRPVQDRTIRSFLIAGDSDFNLTGPQVDFILRLHSSFATNAFEKTTPLTSSLYLGASRFNHSCLPNCDSDHTLEGSLTTITVCSSRDIQPDEEITISYLNIYDPRDQRQACTRLLWGFSCNCPACDTADPTVDTVVHEQRLAEYLQLKQDSYLKMSASARANVMSLKDLDEVLSRSTQRAQIAETLGDNYNVLRE
ncbi:hypothetical protein INS49_009063 [Diaporthe citri]|uniref:uncharacterized protein n=1 Tax=Diaporthe citri TaxID=83186 RepID=UPI001C80D8F7|nr:uncharacterized protein INS49_009063 [Diaporthe citri]KAG6363960.1 hypothetical protein INS49_009063 [Diaporthe citri]